MNKTKQKKFLDSIGAEQMQPVVILASEHDNIVKNLAMMVRRLSYALNRTGANDKLVAQSVELLKKYDLGGEILRLK